MKIESTACKCSKCGQIHTPKVTPRWLADMATNLGKEDMESITKQTEK